MTLPTKVIASIVVLVVVASALLFVQHSSSKAKTVRLTPHDMEVIFREMLRPQEQQQIASDPEEKKKLATQVKKVLAVAQVAEQEGYAQRPELQMQLSLQADDALNEAYRKNNPDVKVTDEEITAYFQSHPRDFEDYLRANAKAQETQGPQRDDLRKRFGEFRVIAERARKEGIDRTDVTSLRILMQRSSALFGAYVSDLQKNAEKLVSDADVEQYYKDHPSEFDEVRVRHILVSTQPNEQADDEEEAKDKKPADKPKALSKEEARKKAQALLERARKGEDFAKLAKENSDDRGSKDKGGEYDFFSHGKMVPEFEKAAFALKPGEISDLVETQYGFHIIKLEDRRTASSPDNDQKVRQQIVDKLKQDKLEARIDEIAATSSVVVPEDFDTTPKSATQAQNS
jgi:peptidyl-prolyl cis-trans isomerase C